jgi:hypothetical protein
MQRQNSKSCPSAPASPGAVLLGVVNDDGTLGYFGTEITVDEEFIATGRQQGDLEKQFRFSSKCVKSGCNQWQDGKCGVISKMISLNPDWHKQPFLLPDCSIRPTCRWYAQEGDHACSHCPYIVTNSLL